MLPAVAAIGYLPAQVTRAWAWLGGWVTPRRARVRLLDFLCSFNIVHEMGWRLRCFRRRLRCLLYSRVLDVRAVLFGPFGCRQHVHIF